MLNSEQKAEGSAQQKLNSNPNAGYTNIFYKLKTFFISNIFFKPFHICLHGFQNHRWFNGAMPAVALQAYEPAHFCDAMHYKT